MTEYTIYAKSRCRSCANAASMLNKAGKSFEYLLLDRDYDLEEFMDVFPNAKTFPQIIQHTPAELPVHIGGYKDLKESFDE